VAALRDDPATRHVAGLIDAVRGTQRPQKGADPVAYVGQIAARLTPFSAPVLARSAQVLLDTRGGYLPDAASVERTARAAEAALRVEAEAEARVARLPVAVVADAAIASRWPEMRSALDKALGGDVTRSWFDEVLPVRIAADGCLTFTTAVRFKAQWITSHYSAALLAVSRQVLGASVCRVEVSSQPAARGAVA
jgi:hypothetical protein